MTNYYVAKNGNDNNIGSETLSFLTIQKGANEAIAGDTVYVKAGTYIEEVNSPNSGTDGKYITFQNYATDVVTLKPPIKSYHTFDSVTPNHHPGNWEILNKSYIRITGFVFGGYNITTQIPYSVITIAYGSHHIIIDNNRFDDFDADAAAVIGQTPITSDQKTGAWNVDIINNYIFKDVLNSSQGFAEIITAAKCQDINISYNTFAWTEGMPIVTKDHAYNITISYNQISNARYRALSTMSWNGYTAPAIYVGGWVHLSSNISVFNNFVINADSVGVGSECGGLTKDMYFYNNIMINCYSGFNVPNWVGRLCAEGSPPPNYENIQFYNNISVNSKYKHFFSQIDRLDIIFRNNIGYGTGSVTIQPSNINEYNSWNLGITDPKFVDDINNNFHLQSLSPCINAGTPIGAPTFDFDNNLRIGNPDIGAYEYYADCLPPQCDFTITQ